MLTILFGIFLSIIANRASNIPIASVSGEDAIVVADNAVFLWAGNSSDDLPAAIPFILIDNVDSPKPVEYTNIQKFLLFVAVGSFLTIPFLVFGSLIARSLF